MEIVRAGIALTVYAVFAFAVIRVIRWGMKK